MTSPIHDHALLIPSRRAWCVKNFSVLLSHRKRHSFGTFIFSCASGARLTQHHSRFTVTIHVCDGIKMEWQEKEIIHTSENVKYSPLMVKGICGHCQLSPKFARTLHDIWSLFFLSSHHINMLSRSLCRDRPNSSMVNNENFSMVKATREGEGRHEGESLVHTQAGMDPAMVVDGSSCCGLSKDG